MEPTGNSSVSSDRKTSKKTDASSATAKPNGKSTASSAIVEKPNRKTRKIENGHIALSVRGNCAFTEKAKLAVAAGASALLVINDKEDLDEMGCVEKNTSLNVTIRVLMISKSSGDALNRSIVENKSVELLLYAPNRPAVDFTAGLLLLMAVGTVVVGSLWSELTDPDQANESYNILSKVILLSGPCLVFTIGTKKELTSVKKLQHYIYCIPEMTIIHEGKRLNHKPKTQYRIAYSRHLFISTHKLHHSLQLTSSSIHLHHLLHP
ncbi:hypothetical protein Bca101_057993 [Brassica carinata]